MIELLLFLIFLTTLGTFIINAYTIAKPRLEKRRRKIVKRKSAGSTE